MLCNPRIAEQLIIRKFLMQFSTTYFIFNYVSLFAAILPLLAGILFPNRITTTTLPFFYFFYCVVLSETVAYLASRYSMNTIGWLYSYYLFETFFFWWHLHQWLWGKRGRTWLVAAMIALLIYWIFSTFFVYGFFVANSFARAIECVIIAAYAGLFLIQLTRKTDPPIFRNPKFWIASGAMIYFSFGVLVFALYKIIADNHYTPFVFEPIWNVHSLMNFISNLLYSIAFLCPGRISKFHNRN